MEEEKLYYVKCVFIGDDYPKEIESTLNKELDILENDHEADILKVEYIKKNLFLIHYKAIRLSNN